LRCQRKRLQTSTAAARERPESAYAMEDVARIGMLVPL